MANQNTELDLKTRPAEGGIQAVMWYGLAVFACLLIALINKGPLYYFDTAGYLEQGQSTFGSLGLFEAAPSGEDGASAGTEQTAGAKGPDGVVVGSRSVVYATFLTLMHFTIGISAALIVQVAALILSVWLAARVAARQFDHGRSVAATTAIPILFASFGSLPFYTAYLMPDIFAPILILVAATLTIFGRDMYRGEILLAFVLGVGAVVTHPSHMLMAILLVPVVGAVSFMLARRRWWFAPVLMIAIVGAGLAERMLFASAVKSVQSSEVVYQPFLTARTIADGPGLRVLEETCPDETLPTCLLFEALQKSDDPYRLTASHIMFERDPNLGSYKLLDIETQRLVAEDQIPFFIRVLMDKPIALTLAFLKNTLDQANLFSIQYTIPTSQTLTNVHKITDIAPPIFGEISLLNKRLDLGWLTVFHGAIYAVSALLVVVIVVLPQKAPPLAFRAFALVILIGVLINAFVCGGVSQPSDRYGARVAFLLPVATCFILLFYSGIQASRRSEDP